MFQSVMKWTTVLPLNDRHIMREPGTAPRPLSGRASGSVRFPHPRPPHHSSHLGGVEPEFSQGINFLQGPCIHLPNHLDWIENQPSSKQEHSPSSHTAGYYPSSEPLPVSSTEFLLLSHLSSLLTPKWFLHSLAKDQLNLGYPLHPKMCP